MELKRKSAYLLTIKQNKRMKKRTKTENKQVINLDYLSISVENAKFPHNFKGTKRINRNLLLDFAGYSAGIYQNQAEIYYFGDKFATIQTNPVELGKMRGDYAMLKVENRQLYTKNWAARLIKICNALNFQFKHVAQIDIFIDSIDKDKKAFKQVENLTRNKIKMRGKAEFQVKYEQHEQIVKNNKGVAASIPQTKIVYARFGSRKSDKYARFYYKRQEIARSNKNYIADFWKANEMEPKEGEEVARFEISLKRSELKTYTDHDYGGILFFNDLMKLQSADYLAIIFETARSKFLDFVKMTEYLKTGKRFNRCKRYSFAQVKNFSLQLLDKTKTVATNITWSAKVTVKQLYMFYLKTGAPLFREQINEILLNADNRSGGAIMLNKWFTKSKERWQKEYAYKFKNAVQEYNLPYRLGATMKIANDVYDIKYNKGGKIVWK